MSLSNRWNQATPGSSTRLNRMTIPTLDGATIASLDKTKVKVVACNATGSGYIINHIYMWSDDGLTETDLGQLAFHRHSGSADGGGFQYLPMSSPEITDIVLLYTTQLLKTHWNQTVSGTGTIEDGQDGGGKRYIRLRPNGTSGSSATIAWSCQMNFAFWDTGFCGLVGQFETASNLAWHGGVNCDDVTAADSNTRKIQAEVCTVTNANYWLRTADNTANSASDTGVAIDTNKTSIKLINEPNQSPKYAFIEINAGTTFQKTTNIAFDSNASSDALVKYSVKNSIGADRPYRNYGARAIFSNNGTGWYGDAGILL